MTRAVSSEDFANALLAFEEKTQQGINRALALNDGLSPTYFSYECVDYEIIKPILHHIKRFYAMIMKIFIIG